MTVGDVLREQFFKNKPDYELSRILWDSGFCPRDLPGPRMGPPTCRECGPCCDQILTEEFNPKIHQVMVDDLRKYIADNKDKLEADEVRGRAEKMEDLKEAIDDVITTLSNLKIEADINSNDVLLNYCEEALKKLNECTSK